MKHLPHSLKLFGFYKWNRFSAILYRRYPDCNKNMAARWMSCNGELPVRGRVLRARVFSCQTCRIISITGNRESVANSRFGTGIRLRLVFIEMNWHFRFSWQSTQTWTSRKGQWRKEFQYVNSMLKSLNQLWKNSRSKDAISVLLLNVQV